MYIYIYIVFSILSYVTLYYIICIKVSARLARFGQAQARRCWPSSSPACRIRPYYIYIYIYVYVCIYIYTHTYIYMYTHISTHLSLSLYIYIYMYVYIHVIYIYIYTYIHGERCYLKSIISKMSSSYPNYYT